MKKPPQELIDAFFKWYESDPHSKNEDYYNQTITQSYLSSLSKSDFIDFFFRFAHEGGRVQSGGYRTSGKFRQTMESKYDQFRSFVLLPFSPDFDEAKWLTGKKDFNHFGIGLATIYLNRIDKTRFPILNNKTAGALDLLDVPLSADIAKRYQAVREAQQQLITWFPQFENLYRTDALNHFLVGVEEGKKMAADMLKNTDGKSTAQFWIFQGNPNYYDVAAALRDDAVRSWEVKQHKKEIQLGDRVILWITGEESGCYGFATVVSDVQVSEEDPKEVPYWKDPTQRGGLTERVRIRVDNNLWNSPVYRTELDRLSGFSDFPAGRQGTNLGITEDHFKAIQDLSLGKQGKERYWIYAPGPNAKYWDECWQKGIMVFGTDELVNLQIYESKDAMEKALQKELGVDRRPTNDARAAWEFSRVLKPGDVIIPKRGRQYYIGYGIVTGPYMYDASRPQYRNIRTVKWVKKGEWEEAEGPIVLKTLTDITKYPEYVEKLKRLIGIDIGNQEITVKRTSLPSLNVILYGPPGTGKTYALRNEYMKHFTESRIVSREQYAQELAEELTWLQVIAMVLYDLGPTKASNIFNHVLLQAKIRLSSNRNPKNTIWAWLQRHTKMECPNVKYAQRGEPLIFSKDENAVWTVDSEMLEEQLPELVEKLKALKDFKPENREIKRFEYVTFHQSYSYEDFVEGIKPVMSESEDVGETLAYEVKSGIFKNMVKQASDDPDHDYALLIDEINRGNVASIFGELIALIEDDKRKGAQNELKARLPYSREEFVVPLNLYIIGAMNTADRSVEALDTALRRRFTFVAVTPQPELILQPENLDVDLKKLLTTINARIEKLLDKDHSIGHSYFVELGRNNDPFDELRKVFATKVLPLLEEYFYGDPAKIGMVLGDAFVKRKDGEIEWAQGDWGTDEYEERRVYVVQDPMNLTIEDFRAIYE